MICTLELTADLLVNMFQPGLTKFKVHTGLPEDSRIVGCEHNAERDTVTFHIWSSHFTSNTDVPVIISGLASPYEAMVKAMGE